MLNKVGKLMVDISNKMRMYRTIQEFKSPEDSLDNRKMFILEMLLAKGTLPMSKLSKFMPDISQSTFSLDIKHLVSKGYVTKTINKENERQRDVVLTKKGEKYILSAYKATEERLSLLLSVINPSKEEANILENILERAIKQMELYVNKENTLVGSGGINNV